MTVLSERCCPTVAIESNENKYARVAGFIAVALMIVLNTSCRKAETLKPISAKKAYPLARTAAMQWSQDAVLVEVFSSSTINEYVENAFLPGAHWVATEVTFDSSTRQFNSQQLEPQSIRVIHWGAKERPITLGWVFAFVAHNQGLAVEVAGGETHTWTVPSPRIVAPISGWNLDSTDAADAAITQPVPRGLQCSGYFHLGMNKFSGEWRPLWSVPATFQNGQFIGVFADDGGTLRLMPEYSSCLSF
jgi:hypothetical protein